MVKKKLHTLNQSKHHRLHQRRELLGRQSVDVHAGVNHHLDDPGVVSEYCLRQRIASVTSHQINIRFVHQQHGCNLRTKRGIRKKCGGHDWRQSCVVGNIDIRATLKERLNCADVPSFDGPHQGGVSADRVAQIRVRPLSE